MSNKPMLSVERELLDRIARPLKKMADEPARRRAIKELRALLDKPEYPRVEIVKAHTHTCACVVGDSGVCDCGAVVNGVCVKVERSVQHQGEPVATYAWFYEWASRISAEGPKDFRACIEREAPPQWAIESGQVRNVIKLYAEQPAPLAVVMPPELDVRDGYSLSAVDWYNLALSDVAKLNGVKS